jgi:hypothetical protein
MPPALPTQRERDPAAAPLLSVRTLAWLAEHPVALAVVESVGDTLAELEADGHHPRLLAALRFVLVHHEPTRMGRCRACRRVSWRGWWRRRRFPCLVWRQIRAELVGPLVLGGVHRRGVGKSVR